jgi:hypothetical protein
MAAASAVAGMVALGGASAASAQMAADPSTPSGNMSVQPASAAPGDQVSVYGLACQASDGTATSSAFAADIPLSTLSNSTGGIGTISPNAQPGMYPVYVTCGSMKMTGRVVVTSVPSTVPKGGAATGDGASLLGGPSDSGAETGVLLALAGAGLGAIALRRRRARSKS